MNTSSDDLAENENLYAFKLQVLHPGKAPYAYYEIWKHSKGIEAKLVSYLTELLAIGITPARSIATHLLSGKAVVYPFATRRHDTPGVVLVPNLQAHVVSHEEAGHT